MQTRDTKVGNRRGTVAYIASSATVMVAALVRYTILARLLGAEQLGLAASMILIAQFFQSFTDSGSDRFLIQDPHGDEPEVQSTVHLVYIVRGIFQAAAFVLFAGPAAAFFHTPELKHGLVLMSLAPLIFGFLHLDISRAQRHHDFRLEGWVGIIAEAVNLIVTVVAALTIHSFMAVVYGAIARSLAQVAVSHLMASRRYAVGYSKQYAPRLGRFAAPLMLNGLMLFFASQSDRALVAHQLGVVELGRYTAVMLLSYYPTSMVMRFMGAMHLPLVSAARVDDERRRKAEEVLAGQTILLAALMAIGFAIVGPPAVAILYGPDFAKAPVVVALIGIMQAMRFIRQWPTTMALSIGRSDIVLINNIIRMVGWLGLLFHGGLIGVLLSFAAGDLIAMVTSLWMLNRANGDKPFLQYDRLAILTLICAAIVGWIMVFTYPGVIGVAVASVGTLVLGRWVWVRERETIMDAVGMVATVAGRWIRV